MPPRQPILATTNAFSAPAATLLAGLAFGASSALLPFIKLNAAVLIIAVIVAFLVHLRMTGGMALALPVSLVSAMLAIVAMWALWFGIEYGFDRLLAVVQQGPKGISTTLRNLAATTSVSVRLSGGTTTTHGPDEVRLVWIIETIALGAAPILGALLSPVVGRRKPA